MKRFAVLFALCVVLVSCEGGLGVERPVEKKWDSVMILYSAGFNNLRYQLNTDLNELRDISKGAYVPKLSSGKTIIAISHRPETYGGYSTPTSPVIMQIYRDEITKTVHTDTLYRAEPGSSLTDPDMMRELLEMVHDAFPSKHYGAIFSSHASGWLPRGYYADGGDDVSIFSFKRLSPYEDENPLVRAFTADADPQNLSPEKHPLVRSFGDDASYSNRNVREMDIREMAAAIPFHLDYIVFDACLMGGIEAAYEFKDAADWIVSSSAEVLGDGMNYVETGRLLLEQGTPDLKGLCEQYYKDYENSSATISLVKTAALPELASVSRELFSKYRSSLAAVNPKQVQGFFRYGKHYFYDFEDIITHCNPEGSDLRSFRSALNDCVTAKYSTKSFLAGSGGFTVNTFCGLSMYLPANGNAKLDAYYKGLKWNQATGLVE